MSIDRCSFCGINCDCGPDGEDHVVFIDEIYIVCDVCMDDDTLLTNANGDDLSIRSLLSSYDAMEDLLTPDIYTIGEEAWDVWAEKHARSCTTPKEKKIRDWRADHTDRGYTRHTKKLGRYCPSRILCGHYGLEAWRNRNAEPLIDQIPPSWN